MKLQIVLLFAAIAFTSRSYALQAADSSHSSVQKNHAEIVRENSYQEVRHAMRWADDGQPGRAASLLKKTIAKNPSYLFAHVQYVGIKTFYLSDYDGVRQEYDSLIARNPESTVYPLALIFGARGMIPDHVQRKWLESMAALHPENAWTHYAQAKLSASHDAKTAMQELRECIDELGDDRALPQPYIELIGLEANTSELDQAIVTAQQMSSILELKASGLYQLWNLRLIKAGASADARLGLGKELDQLASSSSDMELLTNIWNADKNLLADTGRASIIEQKIRRLDKHWYPEKTGVFILTYKDGNGVPIQSPICCRQMALVFQAYFVPENIAPSEQNVQLEKILAMGANATVKQYVAERLLSIAEKSGDNIRIIKYAKLLHDLDPNGAKWLVKLAGAYSESNQGTEALEYARLAVDKTRTPHILVRPRNSDPDWFKDTATVMLQKENYDQLRAQTLDAYGWALYQSGDLNNAVPALQQSLIYGRSETALRHLAAAQRSLGRVSEADDADLLASREHIEAIKRKMIVEPAPQFALNSSMGENISLSALKGKVAVLYFFATWCPSCAKEEPLVLKLRKTYKSADVAIMAVALKQKNDLQAATAAAAELGGIPLLAGDELASLYRVSSPPSIVIIDKESKIRYRQTGFYRDAPDDAEEVIQQLLR